MGNKKKNNIVMSAAALLATIVAIIIIILGDKILNSLAFIYSDWAFPAFFIPWFLIIISSLQKLSKSKIDNVLQMWILKITFPVFIFTLPYLSLFITGQSDSVTCLENCPAIDNSQLSFEPYCIFIALLALFFFNFFPSHYLHNERQQ